VESTISALIEKAGRGEPAAADALFVALYEELHRLADRQLARFGPGAALATTSLLHEAYLDMSAREGPTFPDRSRFFGYAARVMRGLIVDRLRAGKAQKRGGAFEITSLEGDEAVFAADRHEVERLHDALLELEAIEPDLARLVDLKYFCGFTFAEIGALRGVTERSAQRQWDKARLFLRRSLDGQAPA
jgi:RNA polymerase sigma factor (TIGR02999 family)